ncbi:hypothetical protein B9N43_08395 [Denitratisoma sp. DHT3]|uniref:methyl-accepting chemotaxis protein n=1 Tax=Denitratisoma sp. DHT3 TaxID=1981880 RepID=UPI001198468C|nr:methyl-accepting chemotaxis protein [Denitratisoma sp. DHT3]QDX81257.1 hypothetical protein B9N43_08395 [Denitratisoma sp. DHT3]
MSIKIKLMAMIAAAIVGLVLVALAGMFAGRAGVAALTEVGGNRMPSLQGLGILNEARTDISRRTMEVGMWHDELGTAKGQEAVTLILMLKQQALDRAEMGAKTYEAVPKTAKEMETWKAFMDQWETWKKSDADLTAMLEKIGASQDRGQANALYGEFRQKFDAQLPAFRAMEETLDKVVELNIALGDKAMREGQGSLTRANIVNIGVGLAAVCIVVVLGLLVSRSVIGPLEAMRKVIVEVERSHDFTQRAKVGSRDEVGQAVVAFNGLLGKIQESLLDVQDRMARMRDEIGSMAVAAAQMVEGAAGQSSSAAQMAAAVEQITASIAHVSDNADGAQVVTRRSSEVSEEGRQVIADTGEGMGVVVDTVTQAAQVIQALGNETDRISEVVQVIKEVADQTNLLALNAAIEAARAGEQGRGFAVVADEVRKLAERTTQSTTDIATMIEQVQQQSQQAVSEMQAVVDKVHHGRQLAFGAGEQMSTIQTLAQQVSAAVDEISTALREQSAASLEIGRNVEGVAQAAEQNHCAADQLADGARRLESLSDEVGQAMARYRVV